MVWRQPRHNPIQITTGVSGINIFSTQSQNGLTLLNRRMMMAAETKIGARLWSSLFMNLNSADSKQEKRIIKIRF